MMREGTIPDNPFRSQPSHAARASSPIVKYSHTGPSGHLHPAIQKNRMVWSNPAIYTMGTASVWGECITVVLSADMVTFSRSKGLFGGISLEETVIAVRDEESRHYYEKYIRPTDILVMRTVSNPQSAGMRAALARPVAGETPSQTDSSPSN